MGLSTFNSSSSGGLQVDVLESALPAGAATEATLQDVLAAIEDMSTAYLPLTWLAFSRVTGDQTTTLDTAVNCTNMSFAIGANETWSFDMIYFGGCNNTGGTKFAITLPTGCTLKSAVDAVNTGSTTFQMEQMTTSGTLTTNIFFELNSSALYAKIVGIAVNGSTAGTIQLQYASGTATQTSTIQANSYTTARRLV